MASQPTPSAERLRNMSPSYHEKITKFTQHTRDGFIEYYATQVETTTKKEKWQTSPTGRKIKTIIEDTTLDTQIFASEDDAKTYLASLKPVKEEIIHEKFM